MMKTKPGLSKTKSARILVVEDHAVVREGFVALINRESDLEVCGEADGASEALALIPTTKPDLVVLDLILRSGDGMDLLRSLKERYPHLPSLVISMQDEEIYAERALRAGAKGYLMKHSAADEFLDAIRAVLAGEIYISRKMNIRMLHRMASGDTAPGDNLLHALSDRELQIYQMIGAGMSNRDIAPRLGISSKTVETHRENIKHKLGLKDGVALVQSATDWLRGRPAPR